ncbi:platelet endothelial cell adhesion molecule isoform X3 [Genypterus blacodes]|uniref:platelet endothelial cell adhesion molecule isoform X3 n=1 Tax=Genypterus blacodes TaxID=154954 RepID=UPI003F769B09
MGLLILLTSTLLSAYFHPGRMVDAQTYFTIRSIALSIEPSTDVVRDTNVTLRCGAVVSSSGQQALSRAYTIYKDSITVYTKNTSSSEDLLYPLPEAKVSNTGKYKCKIDIWGKQLASDTKKLRVKGLSTPTLHLNKGVVTEGEEVTARCTAPDETGSIIFYFYKDNNEIAEQRGNSNRAEAKLRLSSTGFHRIHCTYTVIITPDSIKSNESNFVNVSVKAISITPALSIFPQSKIYEGDQLDISCTVGGFAYNSDSITLYLSQGTQLLSHGNTKVNHSMIALAKDSGEFECRLVTGRVAKVTTENVSVTELFSVPTLSMSPAEVFQGEEMNLTCRSENFASERLSKEDVKYTLDPLESRRIFNREAGVFSGRTLLHAYNYTCIAQAKGIKKRSKTLTVRPKVSVTHPKISAVGRVILARPFEILCQSDRGSFSIHYTLWKNQDWINTTEVKTAYQEALFTVTIQKPEEITDFSCEAQNNRHKEGLFSKKLSATVIVPLSEPTLTVLPDLSDVAEGHDLILICGIKGTPPVTFKWYRSDNAQPLFTTTSNHVSMDYQIPFLGSQHSGAYYCEAINPAKNTVRSQTVQIDVHMAMWKKAVIVASCLLVVSILVLLCVLRFKSKRVRMNRAVASVWSERPPNAANDEESSVMSNEPDVEYTEVVHPQPADPTRAVPLRKGTDTVYSELQNSPHGADDHLGYQGSVEYAELNGEQLLVQHSSLAVDSQQDLPVPVD